MAMGQGCIDLPWRIVPWERHSIAGAGAWKTARHGDVMLISSLCFTTVTPILSCTWPITWDQCLFFVLECCRTRSPHYSAVRLVTLVRDDDFKRTSRVITPYVWIKFWQTIKSYDNKPKEWNRRNGAFSLEKHSNDYSPFHRIMVDMAM